MIANSTSSSTIDRAAPVVTLLNVFEVEPERQGALIDLLDRATEQVISRLPGFVSANLHRGLDGTKVANYAQWESVEAFEAMLAEPDARPHLDEAAAMATAAPALYEVVSVHRPEDG